MPKDNFYSRHGGNMKGRVSTDRGSFKMDNPSGLDTSQYPLPNERGRDLKKGSPFGTGNTGNPKMPGDR